MPLKRVGDLGTCLHREHDPPQHVVLDSGEYEWECPACGHVTPFTVARPTGRRR